MKKEEVVSKIKNMVRETLGFEITDDNDNILGCHHHYPAIYMLYLLDKISNIYGEEIYNILLSNDYRVLCVSNFAEEIIRVSEGKHDM